MIVVIDDQMMNLEATRFLLTSFGIKGKIELFTNTNLALDFIMAYTIEQKRTKTIDLLITEF